jgi:2-polyprenylphenol 6-hydroxylase
MDVDVAIVGAGIAGAALARALRDLRVALVADETAAPPAPVQGFDARVYAITPGNAAFLESLGAWPREATAVCTMRIFGDDGRATLEFDAYRAGVPALAWIVEDGRLQAAIRSSLDGVQAARLQGMRIEREAAHLELSTGATLSARLAVGADGARSFVRDEAGIAARQDAYPQRAVVANFACERAHRNVAFQWFQGGPVLALLPLPGEHVSMVWSTDEAQAERLLSLAPESLCREVAAAAGHVLGELRLVTPARAFPLRRLKARRMLAPRVALIGDAAHVVHPLAGQGANLGLQDVRSLAAVLAAREPGRDPGDIALLRRYERARAADVLAMEATVHGLYRLFEAPARPWATLRNAGLNLTDRLPVIKNLLIRQAMA